MLQLTITSRIRLSDRDLQTYARYHKDLRTKTHPIARHVFAHALPAVEQAALAVSYR